MKVSELIGPELDYWVAKIVCYKTIYKNYYDSLPFKKGSGDWFLQVANEAGLEGKSNLLSYSPSTSWKLGGPLIEKHKLDIYPMDGWSAAIKYRKKTTVGKGFEVETDKFKRYTGNTPLIAACRCIVASVYGEEVEEAS